MSVSLINPTPVSLLERLRRPADAAAWGRFVELYTPILFAWARRLGLPTAEAGDLVQDVFLLLVRKLPAFRYDPNRRFRGWLWTVVRNLARDRRRRGRDAVAAADRPDLDALAAADPPDDWVEAEYRRRLLGRAVQVMRTEFEDATWRACWEYAVRGRPAAEVAADLGVSVGTVYQAKSRILRRLRRELDGLLD